MTTHKQTAFKLLLFFSMAGLMSFSHLFYDIYQFPKSLAVLFAVFLTMLFILLNNKTRDLGLNGIIAAVYCLYGASWVMLAPNNPPFYYSVVFFSPALYFTAFYSGVNRNSFANFMNILLFSAIVYGLWQFFSGKTARPYSFFGNPIFFAEFIGFCLPFTLYTLTTKGISRLFGFACTALSLPALITASSRGPVISIIFSLSIVLFFYIRAGVKISAKIPAIAVLTAVFLLAVFSHDFMFSVKSSAKRVTGLFSIESPEIKNRLNLALSSFEIFRDSPVFGMGPGAIKKFQQLKQSRLLKNRPDYKFVNSSYAHNDYIQLLAETGLSGLLLFFAFIFSTAYIFEKTSPFMDPERFLFSVSLFSSIIFIVAESFFNFPVFSFPSSALFFIASGLMARECSDILPEPKPMPHVFIRSFSLIMACMIVVYSFFIKPGAVMSNFYLKEALKQDFSGSTKSALLYKKSASMDPHSFFPAFHYAQFLSLSGNYTEALAEYLRLLLLFPYSADIMYNMGSINLALHNYKDAAGNFDEALFYYPGFALAHMGGYKALMALGETQKAQKYLEDAVKNDSTVLNKNYSGNVVLFKEVTQ